MRKWVKKLFFIVFSAIPTAAVLAGNGELPRNFHEVDPANRICRSAQRGAGSSRRSKNAVSGPF